MSLSVTLAARIACVLAILAAPAVQANSLCYKLKGAVLIAQDTDNTVLGKITSQYASDSIFNEYGTYGNPYQAKSIWNTYGTFGNEYNTLSPFNEYSTKPPMIILDGKVIGYLSANTSMKPSVAPNVLKALCKDVL